MIQQWISRSVQIDYFRKPSNKRGEVIIFCWRKPGVAGRYCWVHSVSHKRFSNIDSILVFTILRHFWSFIGQLCPLAFHRRALTSSDWFRCFHSRFPNVFWLSSCVFYALFIRYYSDVFIILIRIFDWTFHHSVSMAFSRIKRMLFFKIFLNRLNTSRLQTVTQLDLVEPTTLAFKTTICNWTFLFSLDLKRSNSAYSCGNSVCISRRSMHSEEYQSNSDRIGAEFDTILQRCAHLRTEQSNTLILTLIWRWTKHVKL